MISKIPIASVIIVNFNGKYYLEECLYSLLKLDFPKDNYEIIVVDNNSTDTSVAFVKINFPEIKIIESKDNLGFSGGCNLGVSYANGKYIVFLNTDTKVDPKWLTFLVKRIESDKNIAAVNSKIYLYYPFIPLTIHSDVYMRSEFTNSINFQPVGILLENIIMKDGRLQNLVRYSTGFYNKENETIPVRWTKGDATLLLPHDPHNEKMQFTITIRSEKSNSDLKTKVTVKLGDKILIEDNLRSFEIKQYSISLKLSEIKKYFLYAIQNSGVVVFKNGFGRDRGAVVETNHTQFYELDSKFFNKPCEVISFCGGSAILRKDLFIKEGLFDPSFFMYYEDVDLSLKFQRKGLKVFYEPKSIVYHIHAGTSEEWSPLFTFNVEKNRLAVILKHFPIHVFIKEIIVYLIFCAVSIMKMFKWRLKENWELFDEWKEKVEYRMKVVLWVVSNMLQLIKKRLIINKNQSLPIKEIYNKLF